MTFVDPLQSVIRSFITYLTHQLHTVTWGIPAPLQVEIGFYFARNLLAVMILT